MATNDSFDDGSNPFKSLIQGAVNLGAVGIPLAGAGFAAYQQIETNKSLNPINAAGLDRTGGISAKIGRSLGSSLKTHAVASSKARLSTANKLVSEFMKTDKMSELFNSVESTRAVMASLINAMDDPSIGLPEQVLISYREQMMEILQRDVTSDSAKEAIRGLVKTVTEGMSTDALDRWSSNLNQYQRINAQLTIPSPLGDYNNIFKAVKFEDMSEVAQKRFKNIADVMPGNFRAVQYKIGDRTQYYIQELSKSGSIKGSLPLDLAGLQTMRMGKNLETGYSLNYKQFIDAEVAQSFLANGANTQSVLDNASIHPEDIISKYFLDQFGVGRWNKTGQYARQFASASPRALSTPEGLGLPPGVHQRHLETVARYQSNSALVMNMRGMNQKDRRAFATNLVSMPGFDPGISSEQMEQRLLGGEYAYGVGLNQGSLLSQFKTIGTATRATLPGTARLEQMRPRKTMVLGSRRRKLGRSPFLAGGTTQLEYDRIGLTTRGGAHVNVSWTNEFSGGMNQAVVLDFKGMLGKEAKGIGSGFSGSSVRVLETTTIPLLDPEKHERMGSEFIHWMQGQTGGIEGEQIYLSAKKASQWFGRYVGDSEAGRRHLPFESGTIGYQLSYALRKQGSGKHIYELTVNSIVDKKEYKEFSPLGKIMVQTRNKSQLARMGVGDIMNALYIKLGISHEDTLFTSPDMLKKAPDFLMHQLRGAYALVVGGDDFESTLADLYSKVQYASLGDGEVGRATGAVLKGLIQKNADPELAGMALAGVYNLMGSRAQLKAGEAGYSGMHAGQNISQEAIRIAVRDAYRSRAGQVIDTMEKGYAIGAQTATIGPFIEGQGSIERRTLNHMQTRLQRLGMDINQSADIVFDMYNQKVGAAGTVEAANSLVAMTASLRGETDVFDGLNRLDLKTYTMKDIGDMSDSGLRKLLETNKQGFLFDPTMGNQTSAHRAIASAASDLLGGGKIYVPGGNILEQLKGTTIKDVEGNTDIEGIYSRTVNHFFTNLQHIEQNTTAARGQATKIFQDFQDEIGNLTANALHAISRGKVRSMEQIVGVAYETASLSIAQRKMFNKIVDNAPSHVTFFNDAAFATFLKGYMGSDGIDVAATMAEEFFITDKGLTSWASRHPQLGMGHVDFTDIHRDIRLKAPGKDNDELLTKFLTQTKAGRYWADEYNIDSWHYLKFDMERSQPGGRGRQLDALEQAELRKEFFSDFVTNLNRFSFNGGGVAGMVQKMDSITLSTGESINVDRGFMGQAIGDVDGDQYSFMALRENQVESVRRGLNKQDYKDVNIHYQNKMALFENQAKAGLEAHAKEAEAKFLASLPPGTERSSALRTWAASQETLKQNYLKEAATKSQIGKLNVRFDTLRTAISQLVPADKAEMMAFDEAMAMLTTVQEFANLKGKKLPTFIPVAERLVTAFDAMIAGDKEAFGQALGSQVFKNTALANEGISIAGTDDLVTLNRLTQTIQGAADRVGADQLMQIMTSSRLATAFKNQTFTVGDLMAGFDLNTHVASGYAGPSAQSTVAGVGAWFRRIGAAAGRADSKLMGIAAAGITGSFVAGSLLNSQGYAPEPMMMPGEVSNPRVSNEIAAGSLFSYNEPGPAPEDLAPKENGYMDMMGRPINMGSTYVSKPNSYQLRGQIGSAAGISEASNYFQQVSGGAGMGSVRITDDRRPITSNYLDKLLGNY